MSGEKKRAQHTPGPFLVADDLRVEDDGFESRRVVVDDGTKHRRMRAVARVFHLGGTYAGERDATAQLFAAAPDLLTALRDLDLVTRAAPRPTEAEVNDLYERLGLDPNVEWSVAAFEVRDRARGAIAKAEAPHA